MTKAFYIYGQPQWLDREQFPEETPATPLNVSSIAEMHSRLSDVLDPSLSSVETAYFYQATSDFLPWMKMGQERGFTVWHEAGKGTAPETCEGIVGTDSYRVRKLYAHWLEQGALKRRPAAGTDG